MKVYTKTGDKGETSLFGGKRVSKGDLRIHAYGTVDELNAYMGLLRDLCPNETRNIELIRIQDRLFTLGALLATESVSAKKRLPKILQEDIEYLEKAIDLMENSLASIKTFILPGGHPTVSYCHISRCVCRRAERLSVQLAVDNEIEVLVIQYLNRLSDYLFVLSRFLTKILDAKEIPWLPEN